MPRRKGWPRSTVFYCDEHNEPIVDSIRFKCRACLGLSGGLGAESPDRPQAVAQGDIPEHANDNRGTAPASSARVESPPRKPLGGGRSSTTTKPPPGDATSANDTHPVSALLDAVDAFLLWEGVDRESLPHARSLAMRAISDATTTALAARDARTRPRCRACRATHEGSGTYCDACTRQNGARGRRMP